MNIKVEGMDDIMRKLDNLSKEADNLSNTKEVKLKDLMPPVFIKECTAGKYPDIDVFSQAHTIETKTNEELEAIFQTPEWDVFVKANTPYANWQEMLETAGKEYSPKRLNDAFNS